MKSRSNHKFSGAHPFLAHWIIRKELYFVCCLHHHCLLGRRNYWPNVLSFNTRFHFRSGKMFLRQGALLDIFLDEGSVLNYSWNFPHLLFFFLYAVCQIHAFSEMLLKSLVLTFIHWALWTVFHDFQRTVIYPEVIFKAKNNCLCYHVTIMKTMIQWYWLKKPMDDKSPLEIIVQ